MSRTSDDPSTRAGLNRLAALIASALLACSIVGCSSVNEKLSAGMGDVIPQWAGGLPADAPPRPGTAQYDEYMKERERNRLLPADQRSTAKPDTTKMDSAR
jgi:pantoate kinase